MSFNPTLRYQIYYTVNDKTPIAIPRSSIMGNVGDIVFIGKNRLEYGEVFNTNELHLLEHFAVRENPTKPDTPDLSQVMSPLLQKPTLGQIWYNKTNSKPNVWNGTRWAATTSTRQAMGNSGVLFTAKLDVNGNVIEEGAQLPMPYDTKSGYTYTPLECAWNVSPWGLTDYRKITYLECYTDSNAKAFMRYKVNGQEDYTIGWVNYQIVGIKDAEIHGVPAPTPNIPGVTATPTLTPTPTITDTPRPTPTVTPTVSKTGAYTRPPTPTPTVTKTTTPLPSITRTITPTPTVTATVTPTVSPSNPPPIYISIFDQTRIANVPVGGEFRMGYQVLETGIVTIFTSDGVMMPSQWLINDNPLLYSVRVTVTETNRTFEGFVDDWLNAGIDREWSIATVSSDPVGSYYVVFKIEIMRNADQQIMDYATIRLQIDLN